MIVNVSTLLSCLPEEMESHIKRPLNLNYIAFPLIKFSSADSQQLPEVWDEKKYIVSVRLLGFIPLGSHTMDFTYSGNNRELTIRDNGYSDLCTSWDHLMTIRPSGDGIIYTDRAAINAGLLTPFVWLFAQIFYRHRQRRWRKLVASEFKYESP